MASDPEKSLRARKKAAAREKILQAASRLMQSRGYEEATMRDIATAAEVSYQTLYNYFPSKGDILHQLLKQGLEDMSSDYGALLQAYEGGLLETLDALFRRTLTMVEGEDAALWRIVLRELLNQDADANAALQLIDGSAHRMLEALLDEAQASGELVSSIDTRLLAATLFDLADNALLRFLLAATADAETAARTLGVQLRIVVSPYLTRGADPAVPS